MFRPGRVVAALASAAVLLAATLPGGPVAQAGVLQTYVVVFAQTGLPSDAADTITAAGGELVAGYDAIGVAIARSDSASFRDALLRDGRVLGASATSAFGVQLNTGLAASEGYGQPPVAVPVSDSDTFSGLQWDMQQIKAVQAHAITGGSASVVVGDIDTGLDYTHPDLAANVDFSRSVSCVGGVPNRSPAAWNDDNGHGTHTAGTIAAASNGIGIVGVAPSVKIAAIKAATPEGFFYPEAVVCSFMWAATHGIAVTNNSYFADPWLFNCRNDAAQRAIWLAEQRAIRYAIARGVTVVAAEGNENMDLAHRNTDTISPDDATPLTREVTNACAIVPVEVPGVVGVSAVGNLKQKAYYSNYGVGVTQLTAPGGDRRFQVTAQAPNGRVLSTYPAAFFNPASPLMVQDCAVSPCATYAYLQGTSMAAPHVAGVAALIVSQLGRAEPDRVAGLLTRTADPLPCPPNPFDPGGTGAFLATCRGGAGSNGFYGSGQVNAEGAVKAAS
ncbi:MAG TPA: S8 family serine peptidase [Chloroflexota bacterium]|jgi:subtilisin family serine protease